MKKNANLLNNKNVIFEKNFVCGDMFVANGLQKNKQSPFVFCVDCLQCDILIISRCNYGL